MSTPPFFGGQGRSPRDVRRDGEHMLALCVLAVLVGAVAIAIRWIIGG